MRRVAAALFLLAVFGTPARGQVADPSTREAVIVAAQEEKAAALEPYEPTRAEAALEWVEGAILSRRLKWHPYFESAYAGGGLTLGVGRRHFVSAYSSVDVRGSITPSGYKRVEVEFLAPHLLRRRGTLSILGGWREATQVGFFGLGTAATSADDRANYSFSQPYASTVLTFLPTRLPLWLQGGFEFTRWTQGEGSGTAPSIEESYSPAEAPGLNASPTYVHTRGGVGVDTRTAPDYTRRGGYYGVILHGYADSDDVYGFRAVEYEAIQHIPIMRDAWVLSLRARVETTDTSGGNTVPFFMMPALGGGSSLRGFSSWRFRDRHSVLVSAEWRVLVNRFLDMALFYDTGKVVAERRHLDLQGLKNDFGIGFRFHGPATTPLRIELARSNEGLALVFASKAAF